VYNTLSHISPYEILAALGALFELVGFVWVVAGVSRALSEEYDKPGFFRRLWRGAVVWLKYVFEEPPKTASVSVSVSGGGRATATGGAVETHIRGDETDVERLDRELGELRAEVERQREAAERRFMEVGERFSAVEQSMREANEQLSQRADEIERHLREIHAGSLRKEKGGALVFMLGTVLTLIAVLI
jgi:hypothetical protein